MSKKQVIYFYEGETEKKLLKFLKNSRKIKAGKVKKFNLWADSFSKIERMIDKKYELFFVVDTDKINKDIFTSNINDLKSYNACLIIQNKNLEDELCFACGKSKIKLNKDFYNCANNKFKTKFKEDKNLEKTLTNNNFNFAKLWIGNKDFSDDFLEQHSLKVNINCKYRK